MVHGQRLPHIECTARAGHLRGLPAADTRSLLPLNRRALQLDPSKVRRLVLAPMAPTEHFLQIYTVERQDQQTQATVQFAAVGAGLAYAVLAASKLADSCVGKTCRAPMPDLLLLAIPLPLFALCGYLVLSASSSLQRAKYLTALEEELQDKIDQPERVRVPTGFRRSEVVWDPDMKRRPFSLRIVNALMYVSVFAIEGGLAAWAIVRAGEQVGLLVLFLAVAIYAGWLGAQVAAAWLGWSDRLIRLAAEVGNLND